MRCCKVTLSESGQVTDYDAHEVARCQAEWGYRLDRASGALTEATKQQRA